MNKATIKLMANGAAIVKIGGLKIACATLSAAYKALEFFFNMHLGRVVKALKVRIAKYEAKGNSLMAHNYKRLMDNLTVDAGISHVVLDFNWMDLSIESRHKTLA